MDEEQSEDSPNVAESLEMAQTFSENEKHCWVCFATDEDDPGAAWVRPCNCKGTSKWVHQKCLQRWVDEKQKGNPSGKVACPQCNTTYIIVHPDMGRIVLVLDTVNAVIYKICPFFAAGVMVGSVYWVAVTYGAVTVMQVMGQDEGQEFLEMSDPLFLLVTLPAIPTTLILGKMVQWEDVALSFLRRNARKLSLLRFVFPSLGCGSEDDTLPPPPPQMTDPGSATRVLVSALVFPTVAVGIGNLLFRSVKSNTQRTAMGAIAFLVVKGVLMLYHKQQQFTRKRHRRILDYPVEAAAAISYLMQTDTSCD